MTIARGKKRAPITELFIEFDGRQLEVLTDLPAARDLFERTYSAMLVPRLKSSAGRLEVLKKGRGFSIRGIETVDVGERPMDSFTDYLKREVLLQFIKARPDLLWIHAAAVERDGSALLIAGPSGQGKSTLATRLCETGWRLLSDDAAPIRMDADEVLPFPQSAFRRKYPGRELAANELGSFEKEEVLMPESALRLKSAPIRAIVFPLFRHGAAPELSLRSSGDAALDLLRNCTNFVDHKETAVERVARLARAVPMYHLSYGDGQAAARELDARSS
jgi:hypothetical protein